ncbi:hypothetical protein GCM10010106_46090 [Thermopolyspora flexuosa]|uniref:Lipoprotein n=1 Tax=Thermopolyspora flexuosa TaxID=103836 RepID=A0A543IWT2_9ACTN|nr:hypothetical protein [Thermopolyspora flexuosa]TQM75033.1 hypothetical protein FHX40_1726 [Thermopolyspora flexuosa]GGM92688.1 hypothetical protein GCM10010106_46090 [Thermopolyspora flexuosa]
MGKCLALLLGCVTVLLCGCAGHDEEGLHRAFRECIVKDRKESARLDEIIGPLLTAKERSTFYEGSDCDSNPEGGAYAAYNLDPDTPPRDIVDRFHAAGWVDVPNGKPPCTDTCVMSLGKEVDGRRIELQVNDYHDGRTRVLEAWFVD